MSELSIHLGSHAAAAAAEAREAQWVEARAVAAEVAVRAAESAARAAESEAPRLI